MKRITVQVQPDHIQAIANVKQPITAISELIWNGLDADANEVRVTLFRNQMDGLSSVRVEDNGHNQIIEYAIAVSSDERFKDTHTQWQFWAISNEMDESVRAQANQKNRAAGLLYDGTENVTVWAKTWGQIIQECKGRLQFFEERLRYQADKESALKYLHLTHEKYLPKTIKK
jgi:hypothetical protein